MNEQNLNQHAPSSIGKKLRVIWCSHRHRQSIIARQEDREEREIGWKQSIQREVENIQNSQRSHHRVAVVVIVIIAIVIHSCVPGNRNSSGAACGDDGDCETVKEDWKCILKLSLCPNSVVVRFRTVAPLPPISVFSTIILIVLLSSRGQQQQVPQSYIHCK